MDTMRTRAKQNLPHVLLTLLSIIQALALELLWTRLQERDFSLQLTMENIIVCCQVTATFLGIVVIWVVYATNVMRFRWVPGISDSIHPFIVGVLQFMMIESLGTQTIGQWLVLMALIFAQMNRVAHLTMYKARRDGDNAEFFEDRAPATWKDFIGAGISVVALAVTGAVLIFYPQLTLLALFSQVGTLGLLCLQLWNLTVYWNRTMQQC